MGRWGFRLFEGDDDLDFALMINRAFGSEDEDIIPFSSMVHQTDMIAPPAAKEHYQSEEYLEHELPELIEGIRKKLDSGLGDKLFDMYRAIEDEDEGEYRLIIAGALMMRAGAKIRDEDIQHLRELVPKVVCNEGFCQPIYDDGFRGPGKRQFLAAIDNYKAGVPRSYQEPSCFACGKISGDIGKKLLQCSTCKAAWYCDEDCQKTHWQAHKPCCIAPEDVKMLNV